MLHPEGAVVRDPVDERLHPARLHAVVDTAPLTILKDAGLVNARRQGRCVYYRVQSRGMKPLIDWIAHYRAFWTEHIDRLERLLEKMDE